LQRRYSYRKKIKIFLSENKNLVGKNGKQVSREKRTAVHTPILTKSHKSVTDNEII